MSNITKLALETSLKKLLLEKPLNKITINDITEECGVNRMTFYYHFQDIYELVEWICIEEATRALKGKKSFSTWQEGFYNIFELAQENKVFIMNVYNSVSREQIEQYLYKLVYKLIVDILDEMSENIPIREEDKMFIANFYKYAFVGLMLDWIRNDMKEDPHEIINKLSILLQRDISRAIENFRTDKIENK